MSLKKAPWKFNFIATHSSFASLRQLPFDLSCLQHFPTVEQWNEWAEEADLRLFDGRSLRFFSEAPLSLRARRALKKSLVPIYEEMVYSRAQIPLREHSWHDVFNGASWFLFPFSKNALIERRLVLKGEPRNLEMQRLAMWDEAGIVSDLAGGQAGVFGHAMWEHAVHGLSSATGPLLQLEETDLSMIDTKIAYQIISGLFARRSLPGISLAKAFHT